MLSSSREICYNPYCKNVRPERPKRGWRLRTGDFAQLCHRCAYVFEEGRFCETFHADAAGWRTCESCRKRIHCGCIASIHTYDLLDFGGVSCIACAKKNISMPPNQRTTLSAFLHSPELGRDLSLKNCNPIAGHSSASGQWRQTFNMWNPPCPRMRYEVDGIKLISEECSATNSDKNKLEKPCDQACDSLNLVGIERLASRNTTGVDLVAAFNGMHRGEGNHEGLPGSNPHAAEKDLIGTRKVGLAGPSYMPFSGITHEPPTRSIVNNPVHASSWKGDQPHPPSSATVLNSSSTDRSNLNEVSREQSQQQTIQLPLTQEFNASILPNGRDPSGKTQVNNGRLRADARGRSPLQPRYWPRVTDQELQQISGENSVITPLFEKMLSASDAGKIGRLVLPKKCAEAYLPTISQPEGVPLKVQDAKGQEWVFQFRFWPNNNSRMYVLDGVTPCIHSMQLQAGDIVTFSRLDPGGKLVMGFRKASSIRQAEQDSPSQRTSNNVSKDSEVNLADAANTLSKDKSSYIAKNVSRAESYVHSAKRKVRTVGPKGKRLRTETEELEKINLTWEEAQEMLRPPPNHVPSLVIIDNQEFEEYEEPPILGKPTISSIDSEGSENVQWVQCSDCNKWRKLPSYTLLPPRWTCYVNSYDSTRSSCSSAQEITAEQLKDMLSSTESGSISKKVKVAEGRMHVVESSDGLETLANLAILVEDETASPSQPTTRHPRHRPGCTCIVCIQPPSGKGPKHNDTCTCNVCLMVKRRFQTQMLRREKRQSEKEAETARKKLQQLHLPETPEQGDGVSLAINTRDSDLPVTSTRGEGYAHQKMTVNNSTDDHDPNEKKPSNSPCKVGIDLNMQPEREDADSCSMTSNGDLVVNQSEGAEDIGGSGSRSSDDAEGKAEDCASNEQHIHSGMDGQVTHCDSKSAP